MFGSSGTVPRSRQAIGPYEDLTIVKRRKLKWYGYVSRSLGLAKTILQDSVTGGRKQGRQKKRWEDDIREWTLLELAKSKRAVENRDKWRKLVVKSSMVPNDPRGSGIGKEGEENTYSPHSHSNVCKPHTYPTVCFLRAYPNGYQRRVLLY